VGPIASLQRKVYNEAIQRRQQFSSATRGVDLLAEISGANGPRRYLLAVANAAEMRGTGGMVLSYGVLSSAAGRLTLDRFGPIDEIRLQRPAPLRQPPDYI